MATFGPIAFASPWLLLGLALLPVIWWLLRVTPPAPRRLRFPPLRLLLGLRPREETPARTPLWLILLRLALAALVIFGLAEPLLNPSEQQGGGPLVLVVDDGWASARGWDARRQAIADALAGAERAEAPVIVVPTAPRPPGDAEPPQGLQTAAEARSFAEALNPRPWPGRRVEALARVEALGLPRAGSVLWLSDGMAEGNEVELVARLARLGPLTVLRPRPDELPRLILPPDPGPGSLAIRLTRPSGVGAVPVAVRLTADDGRLIARGEGTFAARAATTRISIDLPLELRNQVSRMAIEGEAGAGAVALLDDSWRRRPVGLVSGAGADRAQPLLAALYYVERALDPQAELRRGTIEDLVGLDLAVLVLADVGALTDGEVEALQDWVATGGVLVRFAGPRLAQGGDALLPVRLRAGDRALGGALSWEKPAPLAPFPQTGPFAGLAVPSDVVVERQVLAEPSIDLGGKIWARLADGTPLVTGERRGDGWVVLVHTTANADWSNLALSGLFVDMLGRLIDLSHGVSGEAAEGALPPILTLDGFGQLDAPPPSALPIPTGGLATASVDPRHPPGYYGEAGRRHALNLAPLVTEVRAIGELPPEATILDYQRGAELSLKPWFLLAAFVLLLADWLIALALRGLLVRRLAAAGAVALFVMTASEPRAQTSIPDGPDALALAATLQTKLAYLRTGDPELDGLSEAGLFGLSLVLNRRTAAEELAPMGVDPEQDELAFFPLIYWPIGPTQLPLSEAAVLHLNAFMKNGGTLLIDTRDQGLGGAGARRLREIARGLDVPPLIPIPPDHVLTKAFYLIQDFPGRWTGGQLWVEEHDGRVNDGVSAIVVGGNDWAAAWATDDAGRPLHAVVPGGEMQREMAYRFGVNLIMYALTGNYKADQVHVPAILERLGQ